VVVEGAPISSDKGQGSKLARDPAFAGWPLVVLLDDATVAQSTSKFLWTTWTRFEPAADIYAAETNIVRHHLAYKPPMVIDARKKPSLPDELVVREDIAKLVDDRWREYVPNGDGAWRA